jgi:hypothetical protein
LRSQEGARCSGGSILLVQFSRSGLDWRVDGVEGLRAGTAIRRSRASSPWRTAPEQPSGKKLLRKPLPFDHFRSSISSVPQV